MKRVFFLPVLLSSLVLVCLFGSAVLAQQKADPAAEKAASVTDKPADKKDCGCEVKIPADTLAVVNGVKVGTSEVESQIKTQTDEIEKEVVEARSRELDLEINTLLLAAEAKRLGISTAALIDKEIVTKVVHPTEAEAQAFYDKNKAQIQGDFASVKDQVMAYILSERQRQLADTYANSLRAKSQVQVLAKEVTPPQTPADRDKVLATVDGQKITLGELEENLRPLVYKAQEEIYQLRKTSLDVKINDILLQQEADKEKVTTQALLDREVAGKTKKVTDADAQAFYDKNKEQINGSYAQVKDKLVSYLQQQEAQRAESNFAEQLRKTAIMKVFLKPPDPPVLKIATNDRPSKGPDNASITLIEFTDFQCPSCGQEESVLQKIMTEYGDRVRLVVRNFPLEQHKYAVKAAEAAESARAQGKYWEYHDLLFQNQTDLGVTKLKEYATKVGLDRTRFDADLDADKYADQIQKDIEAGTKLGIDSTPTLYINGQKVSDRTYDGLKALIEQHLKEVAKQ